MNQMCKVCGEPAAGFHFGAFTCEGCKSFFGRTYNNLSSISECKNNGECVINKKNRTACKACRLRKCLYVGMSKSGSRYGRRSNWFKIHCLLQEQQQQQPHQQHPPPLSQSLQSPNHPLSNPLNFLLPNQQQTIHQQQQHQQQSFQNNNKSPSPFKSHPPSSPCLVANPFLSVGRQILNGNNIYSDKTSAINHRANSNSSSDSGASSAGPEDSIVSNKEICNSPVIEQRFNSKLSTKFIDPVRSISEPLNPYLLLPHAAASPSLPLSPPLSIIAPISGSHQVQDEPIDLSVKSQTKCRSVSPKSSSIENLPKITPLDLTLVRSSPLSG